MKAGILDANIIVRVLEGTQTAQIKRILENLASPKNDFLLADVALAESVWVGSSFYKIPKQKLTDSLRTLIGFPGISCDRTLLDYALNLYEHSNIDYIDAYLAALAILRHEPIYSYDKDFHKITKVKQLEL